MFRKLLRALSRKKDREPAPSIVLLCRTPYQPTDDELEDAGTRAFGVAFNRDKDSVNFVAKRLGIRLMKADGFLFSFLSRPEGYMEAFPGESGYSEQALWERHNAWFSIDCIGGGESRDVQYNRAARLAVELLSDNCIGVYLPEPIVLWERDDQLALNLPAKVRLAISSPVNTSKSRQA